MWERCWSVPQLAPPSVLSLQRECTCSTDYQIALQTGLLHEIQAYTQTGGFGGGVGSGEIHGRMHTHLLTCSSCSSSSPWWCLRLSGHKQKTLSWSGPTDIHSCSATSRTAWRLFLACPHRQSAHTSMGVCTCTRAHAHMRKHEPMSVCVRARVCLHVCVHACMRAPHLYT